MEGRLRLTAMFLSLAGTALAGRAQTPLGGEFQVSSTGGYFAFNSSAAADDLGDFVVVWASEGRDGDREGIQGQRFDAEGQPLLGEFRVNTYTPYRQFQAAVAADADGDFVVVWTSDSLFDSYADIRGQRFDSEGRLLGGEFQINTYTMGDQFSPAVAADALGNFVVVWNGLLGISGQRFDSAGNALGDEFVINSSTTSGEGEPAVVADASGNFVVVWRQSDTYYSRTIRGRRFDAVGVALGDEFQVNSTTLRSHTPAAAADPAGHVVVVWSTSGDDSLVLGQRYDSAGAALGGEFQVNSTTSEASRPAVATDGEGNFVVAWLSSTGYYAYEVYVHARRFDSAGEPLSGEFQVDGIPGRYPYYPSVVTAAAGHFTVVWSALDADGDYPRHIRGRRFCPDLDGDGVCDGDDNCPVEANPDQSDGDGDGDGDACDLCPEDASASCIFTNGFESGDASAWTATSP